MTPAMPAWEARLRSPMLTLPQWSRQAPDRAAYLGTESGIWQLHGLDLLTGARRQVTSHPVGVQDGFVTHDGEGIVWFQDETGDESGSWLVQPFEGGQVRPFLEGVPPAWSGGVAQAPGVIALGISDRGGFAILTSIDGAPPRALCRSSESFVLAGQERGSTGSAGLSADGALVAVEHTEHGDLIHPALRILDSRTGEAVGDRRDDGRQLTATA